MFKTILVAGASRGIGLAVAAHFAPKADRLLAVSRTPASVGEWVQADLAAQSGIEAVTKAIGDDVLDALLYMGGTWETDAFTSHYSFQECSDEDIERVIAVNLLAPIRLVKALLPALERSPNPKIIFMGALSGRDNFPAREVANSASKFGLRRSFDFGFHAFQGHVHLVKHLLRRNPKLTQLGFKLFNRHLRHEVFRQFKPLHENAVTLHDRFHLLNKQLFTFAIELAITTPKLHEGLILLKELFGFLLNNLRIKESHCFTKLNRNGLG